MENNEPVPVFVSIVVVAAAGTALSGWLDAREWKGRLASGDEAALSKAVKSILIKEEWERMADQSRQAAQGEFNPGRIQEQFERELVFKG